MNCPYRNTIRINGKHEPCGTDERYCGQCRTAAMNEREYDFGGAFDGFCVTSDAEGGL